MDLIKYYSKNNFGNDYIVGDIHGSFSALYDELEKIGFDATLDRLFCVGDLIDRGFESPDVLDFLDNSWVISVRGNHEQMAIDYALGTGYKMDRDLYEQNGGGWLVRMPVAKQLVYAAVFQELPIMIELETANGTVGIVHAECVDNDWDKSKAYINIQPNIASNVLLWGRDKINYKDTAIVKGIDAVVVGHTPRNQAEKLGNVYYIDTGAVFKGRGHFTILDANTLKKVN